MIWLSFPFPFIIPHSLFLKLSLFLFHLYKNLFLTCITTLYCISSFISIRLIKITPLLFFYFLILFFFTKPCMSLGLRTFSCVFRTRFSCLHFLFSFCNKTSEIFHYFLIFIYSLPSPLSL